MLHIRIHERDTRRYILLEQSTLVSAPFVDKQQLQQINNEQINSTQNSEHLLQQKMYAEQQALASMYLKQQMMAQQQQISA